MPALRLPERGYYWTSFDRRYHAVHPGLPHMQDVLWELPHWIPWLAGVLETAGYNRLQAVELYSRPCSLATIDFEYTREKLAQSPSDVFLFSPMTANLFYALQIAEVTRELFPKSTIIFGGVVASPLHQDLAAHPCVDYVCRGRGEYALPDLLRVLEGLSKLEDVGNFTYQSDDDRIVALPEKYPFMLPSKLPLPKVDIFPKSIGSSLRYIRQNYALGCPYTCAFCTIPTIGMKPYYFPVERVLREIDAYRAHYGRHHNVYFGDETFTLNAKRTFEICGALEKDGTVRFDCQSRIDCLKNKELLPALRRGGCAWLEIGLESFHQESLDLFKQRVQASVVRETLKACRDEGLPACSYIINGLPTQTIDDMRRSVDSVCELIAEGLLHATFFSNLVPYPGSPIFNDPNTYGITLRHKDFRYYNEDLAPVFDSKYATSDAMYEVFLWGLKQFGDAMRSKPVLGSAADDPGYGRFCTSF